MVIYLGSSKNGPIINPDAKAHYNKAGELYSAKNYEEAIKEYDLAINIQPDYASAYFNRGLAKALLGDYNSAIRDAVIVFRLEPQSYDAPYIMGIIAEYQNRYEDALAWYKESLSINPKFEKANHRLRGLEERITPKKSPDRSPVSEDVVVDGQIKKVSFFRPRGGFGVIVGLGKQKDYFRYNVILAIRKPELFKKYGKRISSGAILYGPPGVGKTHLARAVAAEVGANVIVARVSQILDMWAGNTEKNIHAIFEQARENKPCIIIFEEIDGLGLSRESISRDKESAAFRLAVNQLLTEMDGIENNLEGIFVIATTNSPQSIDPALKRSGRFSDLIYVDAPGYKDRRDLFVYFTKDMPKANLDYDRLASVTENYSPADIERICDKAVLLLIRSENEKGESRLLTTEDLMEILETEGTGGRSVLDWYSTIETNFFEGKFQVEDQILYEKIQDDLGKGNLARHKERNRIYA